MSLKISNQKSITFFTCLTLIYQLCLLPFSNAAPVARFDQVATYAMSQNTMTTNQLRTVVQQAVSSSVETLGTNTTLNNDTTCQLVNNIVDKLLEAGVRTPKCKPRTLEQLKQQFLESTLNSDGFSSQSNGNCLGLEKLTGFRDDIYYITTSSSCSSTARNIQNIHIDPVCYGNGNHSHCSMDTELQPIVNNLVELENYFPQYMLQIVCRGCKRNDDHCLEEHNNCYVYEKKSPGFHPLKRSATDECDDNGYEKWELDTKQLKAVVACSCSQRSE